MVTIWEKLINPIEKPQLIWPYFVFFIVLIIISILIHIVVDKRKIPKFQKRFVRKVADFLLYIPLFYLLICLSVYAGVQSLALPLYVLLLGVIWLIWLIFLIYYRLVVIREFWKLYFNKQKEEKYLHDKNGPKK